MSHVTREISHDVYECVTPHINEPCRIQLTLQHTLQRTQHVTNMSNKTHTATHTASNRTCRTEHSSEHHERAMSKITLTCHVEDDINEPFRR
mmetsp:Transcript_49342/g.72380  ORF Transcript_49342/g.72380 Transcript_49342/m.72380 type:complete len:92 (+) Transcript_49342:152-427(+)